MINLANIQWGLKGAEELINIHPLFVHFPIALLLTSVAFYLLGSVFKKEELLTAGKWALYFGALSAAVTVWTGLEAAKTAPHGGGTHEMMMAHQYIGYTVLGLSILLSLWVFLSKVSIPSKGRPVFLGGLILMSLILVQGADLGGRMVFLNGVGVGKKSMMPAESGHGHGEHGHGDKEHGGQEHDGKEHAGDDHSTKEHAGDDHGEHAH